MLPSRGVAGGGGGCPPLYKLYRYVPPQRVWFLTIMVLNRVWFSREPREGINIFVAPNEYQRKRSIQNISFELNLPVNFTNSFDFGTDAKLNYATSQA